MHFLLVLLFFFLCICSEQRSSFQRNLFLDSTIRAQENSMLHLHRFSVGTPASSHTPKIWLGFRLVNDSKFSLLTRQHIGNMSRVYLACQPMAAGIGDGWIDGVCNYFVLLADVPCPFILCARHVSVSQTSKNKRKKSHLQHRRITVYTIHPYIRLRISCFWIFVLFYFLVKLIFLYLFIFYFLISSFF